MPVGGKGNMAEKERFFWLGLVFVMLAGCLVPFGSTASAAGPDEIRIGAIVSMSGPNAVAGEEQKWAYEQTAADVNRHGGLFVREYNKKMPIKLIFADDKSRVDQGSAAMEQLIRVDRIDLALSSNTTPINLAAARVCEHYGVFFSIVSSWLEFIEQGHFQWTSGLFERVGGGPLAFPHLGRHAGGPKAEKTRPHDRR